MEKFVSIKSKVMPLGIDNVDTDVIIPAQYLITTIKSGFGEHIFQRMRDKEADFVMNDPAYRGSGIMIAGENFGCGSSREHAVWALTEAGYKVIIAKSFADIFKSNSAKNGLVTVELPNEVIDHLLVKAMNKDYELIVDLEQSVIYESGGWSVSFDYDPFRRHCLMSGQDDVDYIIERKVEIDNFRAKQPSFRANTTLARIKQ